MKKRSWRYGMNDVAVAVDESIHTVRDHKRRGVFDPSDLLSVSRYVCGVVLKKEAGKDEM